MTFHAQKRAQAKPDVITPRTARAHLRSFDQTKLLQPSMIILNRPGESSPFDPLQVSHLNTVGRPQLNVAICGDDLEHMNKAITFEPDHAPMLANLDFTD